MEGEKLANLFPRLLLLWDQKDNIIGIMGGWRDNLWCWEFKWRRSMFEREMILFQQFSVILERVYAGEHLGDDPNIAGRPSRYCWKAFLLLDHLGL